MCGSIYIFASGVCVRVYIYSQVVYVWEYIYIRKWEYAASCTEIHDKERNGRPSISNDEKLKNEVQRFLRDMVGSCYDMGLQRLPQRLQLCIDRNGDYVEEELMFKF